MYTFDISLDGATTTCTARLPLPACETGPGFRCGPGASVVLAEAGCSGPPEQQGFSGFYIDAMPAHARIAIRRDGLEIGTQELDPRYEEARPNGPDCEPACRRASDTLRLPR